MNRLHKFKGAVFVLLLAGLVACASHRPLPAQRVLTADVHTTAGSVAFHHYPADGTAVLLVASPGVSARIWDVPSYGGLAPFLHSSGYDVWVLDWKDLPLNAGFEGHADAAGEAMRALAARVGSFSVVAHGFGGAPIIAASTDGFIERYVLLAVPGNLAHSLTPFQLLQKVRAERPTSVAELTDYRLPGKELRLVDDLLWAYGIDPLQAASLGFLFEPVGPRLLGDFQESLQRGKWPEAFYRGLSGISVPTTVYVAQTDSVAPQWQTFETFATIPSPTKHYRFFSRANGDQREYGHLSILLGDDAVRELYPFYLEALGFSESD